MLPDSLKEYLKTCKDQHLPFTSVSPGLVNSGYSPDIIAAAQTWYEASPAPLEPRPTPPASLPLASSPAKRSPGLVVSVIVGLVLFLLIGTSVSAYLIAADKIPFKNKNLKAKISQVVFAVPFIPKTPKYVLQQAGEAHKKLSKSSFDFSLAVKANGDSLSQLFGSNNLDISVKGYTDYSDLDSPRASLSAFITRDFGFEVRKPDAKNLFLKVHKLPLLLFSLIGVTDTAKINNLLTSDWIRIDTSTLDTNARELLGTGLPDTSTQSDVDHVLQETLAKLLLEDVFPALVMTKEKVDEFSIYKIQFKPSPDLLDKIIDTIKTEAKNLGPSTSTIPVLGTSTLDSKASDSVHDLTVNLYVDQKDFYIRRGDIAFNLVLPEASGSDVTPPLFASSTSASFAGVLKLSDFGTDMPIETPADSITPEQLYERFMAEAESLFGGGGFGLLGAINPSRQFSLANNTKRRSDVNAILNAVEQYAADHQGSLPKDIATAAAGISSQSGGADICSGLVPSYLAALPQDPLKNSGMAVTDCSADYDTGYTIARSNDNRVTVSAPSAELEETISVTR